MIQSKFRSFCDHSTAPSIFLYSCCRKWFLQSDCIWSVNKNKRTTLSMSSSKQENIRFQFRPSAIERNAKEQILFWISNKSNRTRTWSVRTAAVNWNQWCPIVFTYKLEFKILIPSLQHMVNDIFISKFVGIVFAIHYSSYNNLNSSWKNNHFCHFSFLTICFPKFAQFASCLIGIPEQFFVGQALTITLGGTGKGDRLSKSTPLI